jgi:hypothetical protein
MKIAALAASNVSGRYPPQAGIANAILPPEVTS